jgi:hypothetical protein
MDFPCQEEKFTDSKGQLVRIKSGNANIQLVSLHKSTVSLLYLLL